MSRIGCRHASALARADHGLAPQIPDANPGPDAGDAHVAAPDVGAAPDVAAPGVSAPGVSAPEVGTPGEGCLLAGAPELLAAIAVLTEALREHARTVTPSGDRAAAGEPTAVEREVMRLLLTGAKDEALARELSISLRTARRYVAALLVRLDASSRFQAGVHASRRGWI